MDDTKILIRMSWYKEHCSLNNKSIFQCKTLEDLVEYLNYLKDQKYDHVVADGNVEIDVSTKTRHVVQIYCSNGREYSEFYGVFQTISKPMFLDCYRLGTFDGDPNTNHPYNKDELKNLMTLVYKLFQTQPSMFTKKGTSFYLEPVDPMYT